MSDKLFLPVSFEGANNYEVSYRFIYLIGKRMCYYKFI